MCDSHQPLNGADSELFPVARMLLTEALEQAESQHYSDRNDVACEQCLKAYSIRQELERLPQ